MTLTKLKTAPAEKQIGALFAFTIALAFFSSFVFASPREIAAGLLEIVKSRDVLITDYFTVAGTGAALMNSALVMLMSVGIIKINKLHFTGISMAAVFITGGFALFGKNPLNILPILLGSFVYAKMQKVGFSRYVYIALFATGLSPLVTELVKILPYSFGVNLLLACLTGMLIGYIIPPLAAHTVSMHQGYSLFNVGFATGIISLVIVSVLRSFGLTINTTLIWHTTHNPVLIRGALGYFAAVFAYGLWITGGIKPLLRLFKHPGRAVADFVLMDGAGPTFMNMALTGIMCMAYIMLIRGELSGPVLGAIITIYGFAAFGIHPKNYFPVLLGVYIATYLKIFSASDPAVQLAALFAAGLSPIAGQYGFFAGIFAGFLHSSVVSYVGYVSGGMNLYNNGFAAGFVAIIMVPLIESFIQRYTK